MKIENIDKAIELSEKIKSFEKALDKPTHFTDLHVSILGGENLPLGADYVNQIKCILEKQYEKYISDLEEL